MMTDSKQRGGTMNKQEQFDYTFADKHDVYVGFRLDQDLNERLTRAAGNNRSAFIRDAIARYIHTLDETQP